VAEYLTVTQRSTITGRRLTRWQLRDMTPQARPVAERLSANDFDAVVDVLSDAFSNYPVMRFVLGPGGNTAPRLSEMIGFFVFRRLRLGGPMLGVRDETGALVGAAVMTLPAEPEPSAEVLQKRDAVWNVLGQDCRDRHDIYGAHAKTVLVSEPHHHLNMIGIRRSHQGQGLARPLLEAAIAIGSADPNSAGLTLTTETPANVRLYQHFGFDVSGHVHVAPELETWGLFRRKA
jgi:ribosomal protein S18 acetylase RimI-like enzyme